MTLTADLMKFAAMTSEKQERVVKGAFIQLGSEMEIKSPFKTGRFKGNWIGGFGAVDETTTESTNRDAVGALMAKLGGFRMGEVFYYTNSLPYALALEYGHSAQAANGMVRITARRWKKIVKENIEANQ
jgi:hypothetical protein